MTERRRYAEGTEVSVGRSRGEIDDLLQKWGCRQLGWANDFDGGTVMLQFVWRHQEQDYLARFSIRIPNEEELRGQAIDKRSKTFSEAKYRKLCEGRGRTEHRQLALWLRACLNAVDAGIVAPSAVFFPWLVGRDGKTVWETAEKRLPELLARGARGLLLGAST